MMSEIKYPVRVSEKSPIVALDATDRPVLWSQWRDDLTTAVTALNSAAELRERVAVLEAEVRAWREADLYCDLMGYAAGDYDKVPTLDATGYVHRETIRLAREITGEITDAK